MADRRSTKIAKTDGPMLTFDLFTARLNLLPHAFVWAIYMFMWKNVENSIFGHLLYNPVELNLDDEH